MKIFFRYLFLRVMQPFFFFLAGCALIWIMIDLYGNMDDFLGHKVDLHRILYFYALQVPIMLAQVLPATILFSTLFTLLSLNRRSELVALQSGGMAPIWIFSPFFLFGFIWVGIMAYDLSGPAATAEVTRERLLKQVKGQAAGRETFTTLGYVDSVNHRAWMFESLDAGRGHAQGVDITQQDSEGHDMEKYAANEAEWNGEFWRLTGGVAKITYGLNGVIQTQKNYQELDLPDVNTPPRQMSLVVSQPEQLTVSQLSQYIASSTQSRESLAAYRTQWWYRVLHPFSLVILMLFALLQGARTDRRANAGVALGMAILVFVAYTAFMSVFLVAGKNDRLPPFVAVLTPEVIFASIGLYLLAINNGWWWQLIEFCKHWKHEHAADRDAEAAG
jgi:lipopolysaccharide export system permease protein